MNSEGSTMCAENPIIHTQFLIRKNELNKSLSIREIQLMIFNSERKYTLDTSLKLVEIQQIINENIIM